jgi:hypothetical protein
VFDGINAKSGDADFDQSVEVVDDLGSNVLFAEVEVKQSNKATVSHLQRHDSYVSRSK